MSNQTNIPGFDDEMREILDSYLVESKEILEQLSQDLIKLEKSPTDSNLLNNIFRGMHTLKGTSSFLGFSQISELAHVCEDLLNRLRKNEIVADSNIIDILIDAHKTARILLSRIENHNLEPIDINNLLDRIKTATSQKSTATTASPETETVDVKLKEQAATILSSPEYAQPLSSEATIRVDVARLDELMNLVGELVLARNRLSQATYSLTEEDNKSELSKQIVEISDQIDFVTTELQIAVMKTRMVPIDKVFSSLPLLARDLMKATGKEVDLQIYGKETELDKSLIEELHDPLVHMLRNAFDHGIEPPEERIKKGKPKEGTIIINAEREGNYILITMEDDGRGMDANEIKKKALENGLITEEEAREMSTNDALNLIFLPGFSTKKEVSNVSGRGVGMDVVKTKIAKLKGIIDIHSEIDKGTIITLKLPLTLAIIQGLLFKVCDEIFAIPLNTVLEIVKPNQNDIYTIQGREVIRVRDSILPLARMENIIGKTKHEKSTKGQYVIIVGWAEKRVGIVVDSLLGQKEIVIKSLGKYLGDVPGIAGSTILGDGRVILIIDVGQFIEIFGSRLTKAA